MVTYTQDQGFLRMSELLASVIAELTLRGLDVPEFQMIQPGNSFVLDHVGNGCGCAELIIYSDISHPIAASGFPAQTATIDCGSGYAHSMNVAIFREAVIPSDNFDVLPSPADQTASAQQQANDREAIKIAILKAFQGKFDFVLGAFSSYGPIGAAIGGIWQVLVGESSN